MSGFWGQFSNSLFGEKLMGRIEKSKYYSNFQYHHLSIDNFECITYGFENDVKKPKVFNVDSRKIVVALSGNIYNENTLRNRFCLPEFLNDSRDIHDLILALWLELGSDFPRDLDGDFSISIFDSRSRELILATDHLGTQDIYYTASGNRFSFASELKWLLAGEKSKTLDPEAFFQYFTLGFPFSSKTLAANAKIVQPGSVLKINDNNLAVTHYHTFSELTDSLSGLNEKQYCEILNERIVASVRKRLGNTSEACIALSGGLDSRVVAGSLHRIGIPVRSCTFGTGKSDDIVVAKDISRILGWPNQVMSFDQSILEDISADMAWISEGLINTPEYFLLGKEIASNSTPTLWGFLGDALSCEWMKDAAMIPRSSEQIPPRAFHTLSYFGNEQLHLQGNIFHQEYRSQARDAFQDMVNGYIKSMPDVKSGDKKSGKDVIMAMLIHERNRRIVKNVLSMGRFFPRTVFPLSDRSILQIFASMPAEFLIGQRAYKKALLSLVPELRKVRIAKRRYSIPVDLKLRKYYYFRNKFGYALKHKYYKYVKHFIPTLQATSVYRNYYDSQRCQELEKRLVKNDFIARYLDRRCLHDILEIQGAGKGDNHYLIYKLVTFDTFCNIFLFNDPSMYSSTGFPEL